MADDKLELRDVNPRQALPWTELFRGFQVALDPKKLLLAAAGIVLMAAGWWVLAVINYNSREKPDFGAGTNQVWESVKEDREKWNLMYRAAGPEPILADPTDLADTRAEYDQIGPEYAQLIPSEAIKKDILEGRRPYPEITVVDPLPDGKTTTRVVRVEPKHYGEMRSWPWFEDRGPNPYLMVTESEGAPGHSHWQQGLFVNWLVTKQLPVLIEPLRKFLKPIIFILQPNAGFWNSLYFALVLVWTLLTWALFGGAITRMAAVQLARKEKISMREALRFTVARYLSFFSAPLFPLVFVLVIVIFCIIFGFFHLVPIFGDIVVDGLGWPLILLAGIVMAVILVGLVGWPMMYATISTEGSDSFDALSRSYSYVYQAPWHYLWYSIVAIAYGAVLVFFVVFMGSLMVYLGKWAVARTPFAGPNYTNREPSYLFVYAPTSFGWRPLLLEGAKVDGDGEMVVRHGVVNEAAYDRYTDRQHLPWYNRVGAIMVAAWIYLIFLMMLGFGYSYFWCASTIIYLLMRRQVDDTDVDEVYLEEDEADDTYSTPPPAAATAPPGNAQFTMVEPPALKTTAPVAVPAPPPPTKAETSPPERTDGSSPV